MSDDDVQPISAHGDSVSPQRHPSTDAGIHLPASHGNNNNDNNPHGSSPLGSHSHAPDEGNNSVVNRLMRIYESMTQSSTPQNPNDEFAMGEDSHHETDHDLSYQYPISAPGHVSYGILPSDSNNYFAESGTAAPPNVSTTMPLSYHAHHSPPPPQQQQHHHQHHHHHHHHDDEPFEPHEGHAIQQQQPHPPEPSSTAIAPAEIPETCDTVTSSSRALRKRGQSDKTASSDTSINSSGGGRGSKTRKKAKETDSRWSKRFTWPEDLHREFVSAIFDVGLKHSSPSAILEQMPSHEQITSERIKSHLQKYRLHRSKSKKEFMASYDSAFSKFRSNGVDNVKALASGEGAAHVSYLIMTESESDGGIKDEPQQLQQQPAQDGKSQLDGPQEKQLQQATEGAAEATVTNDPHSPAHQSNSSSTNPSDALMLPQLSEAEKRSPIGVSMGYLMGLFFSLKDQLMAQRAAAAAARTAGNLHHDVVYDAFDSMSSSGAASSPWIHSIPDTSHHLYATGSGGGGGVDATATTSSIVGAAVATSRSNIEESTLMKREMQHQMAFQNKMRALKQHELEKYKNPVMAFHDDKGDIETSKNIMASYKSGQDDKGGNISNNSSRGDGVGTIHAVSGGILSQGAGETAIDSSSLGMGTGESQRGGYRQRGLSVGGSDEFWTSDVVDEQLFEFLMNN